MVRENSGISVRLTAPCANPAVGHVRRISDPRCWSALCLVALLATPVAAADKDTWNIRILPATKLVLAQAPGSQPRPYEPGAKPQPAAGGAPRIIPERPRPAGGPGASYADLYRSIPFSHAEYVANPSYRNDAALGLLLGQMPYPSPIRRPVPQYGYVTPYSFDNTFGTPTFSSTWYWFPLQEW